ncbi:MAG: hypothetical protein SXQ77_05560, partial [Halobacteria archaeon]|nr:hypothetical protein [Halobacteria archaeon]
MSKDRFAPSESGPQPLFLDTSGLYPYFHSNAKQHAEVSEFFDLLSRNELPYRPLLTNQYVVDELVSLLLAHSGHRTASEATTTLMESKAIEVLSV